MQPITMKITTVNEFDLKAPAWDSNRTHIERSVAVANAILQVIPTNMRMKALEFGAGTGLLSFNLKNYFSEITLMDNSTEMINVIRGKIVSQDIQHMKPVVFDLENKDYTDEFDIIYSQMVMHHVENILQVFQKFYRMLRPGGYLAVADLYPEDGSFHGAGFNGHKGFEPEVLASMLSKTGFQHIQYQQCFTINKITDSGKIRQYPLFLMTSQKL
jgi:ubiquinone/menaquinone biosynthesis C-methylase UbiE